MVSGAPTTLVDFDVLTQRFGVSRETIQRLVSYVQELERWAPRVNLIGRGTFDDIWSRHVLDSLQLVEVVSSFESWVDFGSGAGFPGLVVAIANAEDPKRTVHLVESNNKKAAFLRSMKQKLAPTTQIHTRRIEQLTHSDFIIPDIVSARAVADLDTLLEWVEPWAVAGARCIFPKGRGYEKELRDSEARWAYSCRVLESRINPESVILDISNVQRR